MTDVTFVPAKSFTGYPDGNTPVRFLAGVESVPVPSDYLDMLREKGLVDKARRQIGRIRPPSQKLSRKIAAARKGSDT